MILSRSSELPFDPLSGVLGVLGATVGRPTRLEASGRWALAFPAVERLKFVAMLRGSGWLLLPGRAPEHLSSRDVCVLGRTAYTIASHPEEVSVDGQAVYAGSRDVAHLGGDDTMAIGGSVRFTIGRENFLLDMLPDYMVIRRSSAASSSVAIILDLMERESERDAVDRTLVNARLGDLLLVEAIRDFTGNVVSDRIGWLGALADPRLGRALRAIHEDFAQPWTVVQLAKLAGMSRAAFSADFSRRVGQPPLTYLRSWRLTRARVTMAHGDTDVASIANAVGYSSQSAFASA